MFDSDTLEKIKDIPPLKKNSMVSDKIPWMVLIAGLLLLPLCTSISPLILAEMWTITLAIGLVFGICSLQSVLDVSFGSYFAMVSLLISAFGNSSC